jgi:Flp pilus assembly protein TadD
MKIQHQVAAGLVFVVVGQKAIAYANDPLQQPILKDVPPATITAISTASSDTGAVTIPNTLVSSFISLPRLLRDTPGQS